MSEFNRSLSVEDFRVFVLSSVEVSERDLFDKMLNELGKQEFSKDIAESALQKLAQREILTKLAVKAYDASLGHVSYDEVYEMASRLLEPHKAASGDIQVDFVTDDLLELADKQYAKPGLSWRLKSLNLSLGSLRQGDFGFIFARPETGKTTFLASEASHFSTQLADDASPVLWFNNEEQGDKVMIRLYQAALGITLDKLLANKQAWKDEFYALTKRKIKIIDRPKLTKLEVEKILDKFGASIIIYDQIDKITGFESDREDLRLGSIYQWARELAKTYAPTIGVCQADGTGEGVKWLTMAHVANAKTSKQAEADFILGIGMVHDEYYKYVRYFNISKNKLLGDVDSDPKMRHAQFQTIIEPEIARYKDIV